MWLYECLNLRCKRNRRAAELRAWQPKETKWVMELWQVREMNGSNHRKEAVEAFIKERVYNQECKRNYSLLLSTATEDIHVVTWMWKTIAVIDLEE